MLALSSSMGVCALLEERSSEAKRQEQLEILQQAVQQQNIPIPNLTPLKYWGEKREEKLESVFPLFSGAFARRAACSALPFNRVRSVEGNSPGNLSCTREMLLLLPDY